MSREYCENCVVTTDGVEKLKVDIKGPCKVKGEVDKKHLIDKFTHLGEKLLWLTHMNTEDEEHHHQ